VFATPTVALNVKEVMLGISDFPVDQADSLRASTFFKNFGSRLPYSFTKGIL
jgi:hypothetical protein